MFKQEILQNAFLMDKKKIVLVSSIIDTTLIPNSIGFNIIDSVDINDTESLLIFRYCIDSDFGEFTNIAKFLINFVGNNTKF